YTTAGLLDKYTDKIGTVTKYQYDSYGRGLVEAVFEAYGSKVERSQVSRYDAAGQENGRREANGSWTTLTLDAVGRTVFSINTYKGRTQNSYDLAGQLRETRDEVGSKTKYAYHPRGWINQVTDPKGKAWTTTYDLAGNVTGRFDPLGHGTT